MKICFGIFQQVGSDGFLDFISKFEDSAELQVLSALVINAWYWFVSPVPADAPCWNNRCSRHVFLCFYSAIFKLMSARFQTFAYNSRTVWSNYMKFWQQFEINEFYVCTNFRGNRSRDFGFMTWKPPQKFCVKSAPNQKQLQYGKKYFSWLYALRYPFIPTNPLSAAIRFFSFFFPFFLPKSCMLKFS